MHAWNFSRPRHPSTPFIAQVKETGSVVDVDFETYVAELERKKKRLQKNCSMPERHIVESKEVDGFLSSGECEL